MERPSNKFIVSAVAVLSVVVLVAAAFALKRPILEQWYLWELDSEDEEERKLAAEKLGELRSVRAISPLIKILRGEYVFPGEPNPGEPLILHYCSEALARIGAPAVPSLIEIFSDKIEAKKLKDPDDDPRVAAVFTLGKIGIPAVHALTKALDSQDKNVRAHAAASLGGIGPESNDAITALTARLKDEDMEVRRESAFALGSIGPAAEAAVPSLRGTLGDADDHVRRAADKALKKIQGDRSDAQQR